MSGLGLKGEHGVAEGVDRLLAGGGLQARQGRGQGVDYPAHSGAQTLIPIAVTGVDSALAPTVGYVATVSLSATKTDTSLI